MSDYGDGLAEQFVRACDAAQDRTSPTARVFVTVPASMLLDFIDEYRTANRTTTT